MALPTYARLGITKDEYHTIICREYDSGKSQADIAEMLGAHVTTIESYFKKNGIKTRDPWASKPSRSVALCEWQRQVLDGLLLGGSRLEQISKTSARLSFGYKFRQTIADIEVALSSLSFGPIWESPTTGCFHCKSHAFVDLLPIRRRWYPERSKTIPKDIQISRVTTYWWYISGGFLSRSNSSSTAAPVLCTEPFSPGCRETLVTKLADLGIESSIRSTGRIWIRKRCAEQFLRYCSPNPIAYQYTHKWRLYS